MKKLLIHTCCAPCFTYIQEELETQGLPLPDGSYEKVAYTACWYNPNIHPKVEYERRKQAFISFCDTHNTTYHVVDSYDMEAYAAMVATQVGQDKKYRIRCEYCYMLRLRKVFEIAKENGYDIVSTTLTISPYQNHEMIQKVGKQLEEEYGISFCYVDYRPHFREGQRMARELSIYMQKYCGCMFSMEMRYYNRNPIQARATNGYEIPKEPRMQVKKIENKEDYIDLLLEADPSKDMIHKYLNDSDVYALKKED
ncbi:MAG: epoxyqueuosine reductase QueH, partial [Longicatena sp.]